MAGWIKLHRKMLEWEWYGDINVCRLWMHLLLKANHKPNNWKGITVQAGQCVTGRHSLAKETGLTEQQIRTALNKLKSTGEVTSKIFSKFSLITITSWNEYQQDNQHSNQQSTSNQPASNHKQECKEGKKGKNGNSIAALDFSKWPEEPSTIVLKDFKSQRKKPITQTAINRMSKTMHELRQHGVCVDDVLSICCERGWESAQTEWVLKHLNKNATTPQQVLVR